MLPDRSVFSIEIKMASWLRHDDHCVDGSFWYNVYTYFLLLRGSVWPLDSFNSYFNFFNKAYQDRVTISTRLYHCGWWCVRISPVGYTGLQRLYSQQVQTGWKIAETSIYRVLLDYVSVPVCAGTEHCFSNNLRHGSPNQQSHPFSCIPSPHLW